MSDERQYECRLKERNNKRSLSLLILTTLKRRLLIFPLALFFVATLAPSFVLADIIQLPQTGQTACLNSSGSIVACAGTGQDGALQMGVAWPSPRFSVNTASPDNGNTITDNLTGLIWAKDAGAPTFGACTGGVKTWQGALDYVKCLNTNSYQGHNDWRLPNINELGSLINKGLLNTSGWLNTQGFTNVQVNVYWSSSTYASNTANAGYIFMDSGVVYYDHSYLKTDKQATRRAFMDILQ